MVDLWGARWAIDACEKQGIDRFVMISASGAADPEAGPEPLRPYLVAKRCADDDLQRSSPRYTILRPVTLTDETGTGHVATGADPASARGGQIARDDVAQAVVVCLAHDETIGCVVELYGGETRIEDAIRSAC